MSDLTAIAATTSGAVLGAVLVKLRTLQGMKQSELAEAVGAGPSTWSRIEKGETSLSIDQLRLVAKALGKTPGQILDIAEAAENEVIKKGVKVEPLGTSSRTLAAMASLGISSLIPAIIPVIGVALGALISSAVSEQLNKKPEEESEK